MIGFFPEIYPDELLYSQLCRYHRRNGYTAFRFTCDDVYRNRAVHPDMEFLNAFSEDTNEIYPERPDGGRWIAQGTRYGMDFKWENDPFSKYAWGGERRASWDNFFSSKSVELHVYDTQPDLNKYEHGPVEIHDDNLCKMLYILYKGIPFEYTGFNLRYLEDIPHLASCGLLRYENDKPQVAIPVLVAVCDKVDRRKNIFRLRTNFAFSCRI